MKKTYLLITLAAVCCVLLLSACSSVVITDGTQDAVVGNDRQQKGCGVKVDKNFTGVVAYKSPQCEVTINQTEQAQHDNDT
ncbi:MAG: hypothetical protein ACK5NC_11665 [Vibrio sp.]